MVLTKLGEVGIHTTEGRTFVLRPSLYAMSLLGESEEIVETFQKVMEGDIATALVVLDACGSDDFVKVSSDIFGYFDYTAKGWEFIEGIEPPETAVVIAQHLMVHGVTGNKKPSRFAKSQESYTTAFKPEELASLATAHLGYNEKDSWNITLTGLLLAIKAKYPHHKTEDEKMEQMAKADEDLSEQLLKMKEQARGRK